MEAAYHDSPERNTTEILVMFRILTRREWDVLQSWHRACPGSTVEHIEPVLYVLTVPASSAGANEAKAAA